jgi:hypothetical protein
VKDTYNGGPSNIERFFICKLYEIMYDNKGKEMWKWSRDDFEYFKLDEIKQAIKLKRKDEAIWTNKNAKKADELSEKINDTKDKKEKKKLEKEREVLFAKNRILDKKNDDEFVELVKAPIERFKKANPYYIKMFEFADNDGDCVLEHCNIFRNLTHIRVNNH